MRRIKVSQFFRANSLVLIILLAIIVNFSFFVSLQPWKDEVVKNTVMSGDDAPGYRNLAHTLFAEKSFKNFGTLRTPGYPLFIAVIFGIIGERVWVILLLQILLNILSVVLIYKIALIFFTRNVALLSAFLFVADIHQALYAVSFLTESLFDILFFTSIYLLCKGLKTINPIPLFVSAIILGITTLVRPITIFFPFVAIILIFFYFNKSLKMKLMLSLLFGLIFMVGIAPWLLYNYSMYGEAKLSSISSYNLLFCNVALTEANKTGKTFKEVQTEFQVLADQQAANQQTNKPVEKDKIYFNIAKDYIKDNLILYCKINLMGVINLYSSLATKQIAENFHLKAKPLPSNGYEVISIFSKISNFIKYKPIGELIIAFTVAIYLILNYVLAFYGTFRFCKNKEYFIFLFILIILYFTAITGAVGEARYRVPFMPFINILCALGIFDLWRRGLIFKQQH